MGKAQGTQASDADLVQGQRTKWFARRAQGLPGPIGRNTVLAEVPRRAQFLASSSFTSLAITVIRLTNACVLAINASAFLRFFSIKKHRSNGGVVRAARRGDPQTNRGGTNAHLTSQRPGPASPSTQAPPPAFADAVVNPWK